MQAHSLPKARFHLPSVAFFEEEQYCHAIGITRFLQEELHAG